MLHEVSFVILRAKPEESQVFVHMNEYYVYIATNKSHTLYVGVTNDLERRIYEHKNKCIPGFTYKYNITQLVYFETAGDINDAIAREKQIKGWLRRKKIALIESMNPNWDDLSCESVYQKCHPEPFAEFTLRSFTSFRMTSGKGSA